jgi:exopolyphosphatase/guanosine-5'-triphosphate,3'-diphosphate pyrophosphatase
MTTSKTPVDDSVIAAMDIGTNSVRMAMVRLEAEPGSWSVLSQHKETVRLGQDEFAHGRISEEAIQRGVLVLKQFAQIARGRGASEIVAIATAALREAENQHEFIERAAAEAGVEVQVVPGVEEARLIYLGVASGVELGNQRGLFVDIGGGSTELIIGTQSEHLMLDSLKLGAIRLGNRFLTGITGPVSPALYESMRAHTRAVAAHACRKISALGFDVAVASSGTAMNLAAVAARRAGLELDTVRNYTLRTEDLSAVAEMLCKLTLEERRRVPGLNPERADIIVSGAAVLETLAEVLNIKGFVIADRSLREGVLIDVQLRRAGASVAYEAGVRRRSIDRLLRLVETERAHAQHVAHLALRLFDEARTQNWHEGGPRERELMEFAGLLHDIGVFVSRSGHHRHSHYLIRHSELAGFTDEEIQVIANLAYFHRKSPPKKRHTHFQALSLPHQDIVRKLSALLRLAEGLDRSHLGLVEDVRFSVEGGRAVLTIFSETDPRIEVWYISNELAVFEETFGLPLDIRISREASKQNP